MNEYIITGAVAVIQILLSIHQIVRKNNVIASISEILTSLILFVALNEVSNSFCGSFVLTLIEYLAVKIFLVVFMLLARQYSFYETNALCRKKKKRKINSLKVKFIRTFSKVKYWPKLKLGLAGMAGKTHKKTKVKFDSKGFPKFKSIYRVKLRRKYWRETRERHFYMANKILYRNVKYSYEIKKQFSRKQYQDILNGNTPSGYTWHHHQDAGVLELVDESIHAKTSHIGGYSIWGGK